MKLVLLVLVLMLPDLALHKVFPRVLGRLAFRRMPTNRRFVLPGGARAPAETPGYRDDAVPRVGARLPLLPDRIEVAPGAALRRDGEASFVLACELDLDARRAGFVVRIDAHEARGEIALRARQAPPFVVLPSMGPFLAGWLIRHNPPSAAIGIVIATAVFYLLMLVPWLLDTRARDRMTTLAMERIEEEAIAAASGDAVR